MADFSKEDLEEALRKVLHSQRSITDEIHSTHHKWVAKKMQWEERLAKLWVIFARSFVGAAAISLFAILAWIGKLIIEAVTRGNYPGGH